MKPFLSLKPLQQGRIILSLRQTSHYNDLQIVNSGQNIFNTYMYQFNTSRFVTYYQLRNHGRTDGRLDQAFYYNRLRPCTMLLHWGVIIWNIVSIQSSPKVTFCLHHRLWIWRRLWRTGKLFWQEGSSCWIFGVNSSPRTTKKDPSPGTRGIFCWNLPSLSTMI